METPHQVITIEHPENAHRNVTLICGPPGAGKTTLALQLHPQALDIGDLPPGTARQRSKIYARKAWRIGNNPHANTAVTRGAPTEAERARQRELCKPARTVIMLTPADECHRRVTQRNRPGDPGRELADQHDTIDTWWTAWQAENT